MLRYGAKARDRNGSFARRRRVTDGRSWKGGHDVANVSVARDSFCAVVVGRGGSVVLGRDESNEMQACCAFLPAATCRIEEGTGRAPKLSNQRK